VLLLYTGGTIGSVRMNPENREDPLVPGDAKQLLDKLPIVGDSCLRLGGRLVSLEVIRFDPLLDSAEIGPSDWVRIARLIEDRYNDHAGFVILHGTDTMAFTASALAFMFENLTKPIVITGAQRPIGDTRSDASQNIVTAIEIAGASVIGGVVVPEVTVYFRDRLYRGCRVTKRSAEDYHAFHSPNQLALGNAGAAVEIIEPLIRRPSDRRLRVHKELDQSIAVLELSPLMNYEMLACLLQTKDLHGLILKTYGAGNAPTDPRFLDILGEAIERGVKVVAVTQCSSGTVKLGRYEVSVGLLERGVISGLDLTSEAAQTKMAVLLKDRTLTDRVEDLMQVNLRGEMDLSLFDVKFGSGVARPTATVWQDGKFPAPEWYRKGDIREAKLRMLGIEIESDDPKRPVRAQAHLNDSDAESGDPPDPGNAIPFLIHPASIFRGRLNAFVDVTDAVEGSIDPARVNSVTLVCEEGQSITWSSLSLAIFRA